MRGMDEFWQLYAKWKKSDVKDDQNDSTYIRTFLKMQSYDDRKQLTDCQGPGVGAGDWLQRKCSRSWLWPLSCGGGGYITVYSQYSSNCTLKLRDFYYM